MTTSGTAVFNPTLQDVIEEAASRAGREIRSGYQLREAMRKLNFLSAEFANRGLNLWTVDSQTLSTVVGQTQYTLPADSIDVLDMVWTQNPGSANQIDIAMERYSVSQWAQFAVKNAPGPPYAFYVTRLDAAPIVSIWFQPDNIYTITYWRLRRMQDANSVTNTADLPFRFIPALTAGLAYYLALGYKDAEQRVLPLKNLFEEAFQLAADEDRDRASVFFLPYSDDQY